MPSILKSTLLTVTISTTLMNLIKAILALTLTVSITISSLGQKIVFIKDSIMNDYMLSGFSNEHFIPDGKTDKAGLRQGKWKDFEVIQDFVYLSSENGPIQEFGQFLLFGEGKFIDGKREGKWKFYVLEDKSFKKYPCKVLNYKDGLPQGEFKYLFPSGKTGIKGTMLDGKYEGTVTSYYNNGKLYGTRYYTNNLKTGKHTYFYQNGQLKLEHSFRNDTLNGQYKAFYQNGNIEEEFTYLMGKEDGVYKYYHSNGQLWVERFYENGLLMNINGSYDKDGKSKDVGSLKDGNGTVKFYTSDGKLYAIYTYKKGILVDKFTLDSFY